MGAGARLVDVIAFVPSLSSLTRGVERLSAVTAEGALGEEFILMEEGKNFRGSPAEGAAFESGVHGRLSFLSCFSFLSSLGDNLRTSVHLSLH